MTLSVLVRCWIRTLLYSVYMVVLHRVFIYANNKQFILYLEFFHFYLGRNGQMDTDHV